MPGLTACLGVVVHLIRKPLLKRIKEILANDITQRSLYGLGLVVWTWTLWDDISENSRYATSSLGINYLTLYTIPALMMGLQMLRNNKILWMLMVGLFSGYIAILVNITIRDAIKRSGSHVKAIDWSLSDIGIILGIFAACGLSNWILLLMRPQRWI